MLLHLFRVLQDSTPDVSGQFNVLLAAVLGFAGVLFTGGGKWLAKVTAGADAKLTTVYKKFQPVIALGLSMLVLPWLAGRFPGIALPSGEVLASAPIGTLAFIVLRELKAHFFPGTPA
jgi:hypothetical protein